MLTFKCFINRSCVVFHFCPSAPCLSGGNCTNQQGDYSCACVANKTGKNCELTSNACSPNPCGDDVCAPSEFNVTGYQCIKKDQVIVMEGKGIGNGKSNYQLEKEIEELIKSARQPGAVSS